MDDRVQLVFSWDPRAQTWLKERGPDDAAKPPAKPIDDGAVQTYFLDPQTGRWVGTILGARARTIGQELGHYYRSPGVVGLAFEEDEPKQKGAYAEIPQRRPVMPVAVVAGVVLAVVIGAGTVASKTLFAGANASDVPQASSAPRSTDSYGSPQASVAPSAGPSAAATDAAAVTPAPTASSTAPRTAPPRTPAPTPPPQATTVIYSITTVQSPTGLRLFYSGPNVAAQGTAVSVTVNALYDNGEPYRYPIDVRFGNTGWSSMATRGDGRYTASLPLIAARGQQPVQLNVHFGNIITPYTLGTITVQ